MGLIDGYKLTSLADEYPHDAKELLTTGRTTIIASAISALPIAAIIAILIL